LREEAREQCLKISCQADIIRNSKILVEKCSPIFEEMQRFAWDGNESKACIGGDVK